ncbi:MAG: aconitate hydratase [Arcobacter sp.]|nr:MAG: aconitate hydratase [Arcobacter sp.]
MNIEIHNDNGTVTKHNINKKSFTNPNLKNHIGYISSQSKENSALNIIEAYYSDAKAILFDETNKIISKKLDDLNIKAFGHKETNHNIFDKEDFSLMFFTSGSTGVSVGALKTKANLEAEVYEITNILKSYNIKKVILTVPFIHYYGTAVGLLFSLLNDIDIVLKEHFLPNDLLDLIDDNTLIITTPLYIKALNKLQMEKDLKTSIFISSTAPLDLENIKLFNKKFNTNVIQLFGSTETGGIAYKYDDETLWTPFETAEITVNEAQELKVKSPIVSDILYADELKSINGELQTFDYIEWENDKFRLVGRSSQILKIAGKRYSTIQIEEILENLEGIEKAMVFVNSDKDSLRGEFLDITIESKKTFTSKEIKQILKANLSNLKFSINLKIVDKIPTSSVGKKLKIN